MRESWRVRSPVVILTSVTVTGALLYALPWHGTDLQRLAATHCSVPVGITYHVEVIPLENLPLLVMRCAAIGSRTRAAFSPMGQMEAEGMLNTSPIVSAEALQTPASRSGWYLIEQRLLVDRRTFDARPAGFTATPLGGQ